MHKIMHNSTKSRHNTPRLLKDSKQPYPSSETRKEVNQKPGRAKPQEKGTKNHIQFTLMISNQISTVQPTNTGPTVRPFVPPVWTRKWNKQTKKAIHRECLLAKDSHCPQKWAKRVNKTRMCEYRPPASAHTESSSCCTGRTTRRSSHTLPNPNQLSLYFRVSYILTHVLHALTLIRSINN